jgi:hypothetical protein
MRKVFSYAELCLMASDRESMLLPESAAKWDINISTMRRILRAAGFKASKQRNACKRLTPEQQTTARLMGIEGKSLNAIATVVGVGRAIIQRDLIAAGIWNESMLRKTGPKPPEEILWCGNLSGKYLSMRFGA